MTIDEQIDELLKQTLATVWTEGNGDTEQANSARHEHDRVATALIVAMKEESSGDYDGPTGRAVFARWDGLRRRNPDPPPANELSPGSGH
jgi:hypothetical protein